MTMKLATYGAILSYAIELEEMVYGFYALVTETRPDPLFLKFLGGAGKRIKHLERIRRGGVAEIIVKPIHSLVK
jgi:hypothetical protein